MNEPTNRPHPRTPAELQAQLIAECEAERDLPPDEIGKQMTALDSPLAMSLWERFLNQR